MSSRTPLLAALVVAVPVALSGAGAAQAMPTPDEPHTAVVNGRGATAEVSVTNGFPSGQEIRCVAALGRDDLVQIVQDTVIDGDHDMDHRLLTEVLGNNANGNITFASTSIEPGTVKVLPRDEYLNWDGYYTLTDDSYAPGAFVMCTGWNDTETGAQLEQYIRIQPEGGSAGPTGSLEFGSLGTTVRAGSTFGS